MKIEKAIERLKIDKVLIQRHYISPTNDEEFDIAISALEKQEPKKVKYINSGTAVCPDEDCYCSLYRWYSNCPDCGQKLDWSSENE